MKIIKAEDLSWESYNLIINMVDEMEKSGLVKLACEKSERWIMEHPEIENKLYFLYKF